MKRDKKQLEEEETEITSEQTEEEDEVVEEAGFKAYLLLPIILPALLSALVMYIMQQSVTGATRNLIVMLVIGFAVAFSCREWITGRIAAILTLLGILSLAQAFIPDFIMPVAGFGVMLAMMASPALGAASLALFSAMPFLVTERSFEYFLFYVVTGMIAIALIYARRKTGKYTDAIIIFIFTYILLYTGLIVMKRLEMTPELIIGPVVGLVADVIIMSVVGFSYYTNVVKQEEDLYLNVVDPEHPLLIKLKNTNKREYKRAIHTAHFTELFAEKFGYDRVLMKGLGFYHRIGVLREDDEMPLELRTVALAMDEGFPEDIVEGLKAYGEAKPGEEVSAEVSITIIVDNVIISLMDEFSKGNKNLDMNKFIDKAILGLFSGKGSLLKKSKIPYNDLEEIRKYLKGEKIYYDFLR